MTIKRGDSTTYIGPAAIAPHIITVLKRLKVEHESEGILRITKRIEIAILNLAKEDIEIDDIVKWVAYVFNSEIIDAKGWILDQITSNT